VLAYGKPGRPWTTDRFDELKALVARTVDASVDEIDGRTYVGGAEVRWPGEGERPTLRIQVEVGPLAVAVIQCRTTQNPVPLKWLLQSLVRLLRLLDEEALTACLAATKERSCRVGLSDWPEKGIDPSPLLPQARRTGQHVFGYALAREYRLGQKLDAWEIAHEPCYSCARGWRGCGV